LQQRLPRDLGAVCLKALHKLPGRRYASAREMVVDLERFLRFEPVVARVVLMPAPLRALAGAYRRYRAALLLVLGLLLAIGGAALVLGHFFGGERARQAAATERVRQAEARRLHAGLSPYLGYAGSRDDRLSEPSRARQVAALDALLALDAGDVLARFLRLWVRGEEVPAPPELEADRRALVSAIGADRLERLHARVALPLQQRARNDRIAARAAMQAALAELDPEPLPRDALGFRLRAIVLLQLIELDLDARRALAAEVAALNHTVEEERGRTAFTAFAGALAASVSGDLRAARELFMECDRLCPDQPNTLINLAHVLLRLGQPQTARPVSEAALAAVRTPHANFLETHARVLIALHDFAAAEAVLARFGDDKDSRVQHAIQHVSLCLHRAGLAANSAERRRHLEASRSSLRVLDELRRQGRMGQREQALADRLSDFLTNQQDGAGFTATGYLDLILDRYGAGVADPLDLPRLDLLASALREEGETRWADFVTALALALRRLEQDGVRLR
jgi:tetratricopeptide (TPR) repeat protein